MAEIHAERIFHSPESSHYFFGYFGTPQVSADESKILALKCGFIDRMPGADDTAEVGWFDLNNPECGFCRIGTTNAFNWQQGCMLQFLGPDFASRAIYNRFDGKRFVSQIFDLGTGESREAGPAVYGLFPGRPGGRQCGEDRHH